MVAKLYCSDCAAGDHIKFNYPMAYSTVILTWGLLEFKDAYEASGQLQWMYESIKWPLDYLLKCHVADDVLYVQVNNLRQDSMTEVRIAQRGRERGGERERDF